MTDRPASVRMATMVDMEALVDLCRVMHAECAFHGAFVEQRVRDGLVPCLDRQGGVVGVLDGTDAIQGGVALFWTQQWYTNDWQWIDRFIYVRPEARSTESWDALTDFAKWFTDQVSPPGSETPLPLTVGIFQPPAHVKALCRLFGRKFVQVGGTFVYGTTSIRGRMEIGHG